jgi:antitoxin component of MazEF toxin-antitoxin module
MRKKLVQHGNSSALIIEKPIMELLHIDQNTTLEVSTDGKKLIVTPISGVDSDLETSLKKINKKHSATLRKLAK